jgi:hypothetical protein
MPTLTFPEAAGRNGGSTRTTFSVRHATLSSTFVKCLRQPRRRVSTGKVCDRFCSILLEVTASDLVLLVVSQATSLVNIRVEMSQATGNNHQGIFMENGSGGFMSDLYFNGCVGFLHSRDVCSDVHLVAVNMASGWVTSNSQFATLP